LGESVTEYDLASVEAPIDSWPVLHWTGTTEVPLCALGVGAGTDERVAGALLVLVPLVAAEVSLGAPEDEVTGAPAEGLPEDRPDERNSATTVNRTSTKTAIRKIRRRQ
jgi:hypothetical protein